MAAAATAARAYKRLCSALGLGLQCFSAVLGGLAIVAVVLYPVIGLPFHSHAGGGASSSTRGTTAGSGAGTASDRPAPARAGGGGASGVSAGTTEPGTTSAPAGASGHGPTGGVPAVATTATTGPPQTTSAPQTTAPPTAPAGDIGTSGDNLTLNGQIYRFTGVNAYEIGTDWGTNAGCGTDVTDAQLDQFFASLRPNSLVRFWAFQATMATNANTGQIDWGPIDRVFAAAAAYGQRLIPVLTDQGGTCDGNHWQDPSWYDGGFQQVFDDPAGTNGVNLTPLSYWDYLQDIVNRYKDSPALGMWEPISEAEASTCPPQDQPLDCSGNQTCPDETAAAQAMRHFFDTVGAEIHSLDPDHLVESGLLGSGQCGTSGADYQYVSASPGIDVLSYHDYYDATAAVGGDQWNGLAVRFAQAAALDKPIIGGEAGIEAGSASGCLSDAQRASDMEDKIQAQVQAGSSGVLVWDWVPTVTQTCSYDVAPADPVLSMLRTVSL
jgi:hypothetical protein